MTDETSDRIRALNERIAQWDDEHAHEIQQKRDAIEGLKATLSLSLRVAFFGSIPSLVFVIYWAFASSIGQPISFRVIGLFVRLFFFGAMLVGAARAGGLLAHWWFWRSDVNQRLATIIIAVTIDFLFFGWVMAFFQVWYSLKSFFD